MNWQKIIKELMAAGLTQADIGAAIGVTQGRISQIVTDGGDLMYSAGVAIAELHAEHCKPEQTEKSPA